MSPAKGAGVGGGAKKEAAPAAAVKEDENAPKFPIDFFEKVSKRGRHCAEPIAI